jgi:hypothetical protein
VNPERWLEKLPVERSGAHSSAEVAAVLLPRTEADELRIVPSSPVCLHVAVEDVESIRAGDVPPGRLGAPVRVVLRSAARLRAISSAEHYRHLLEEQRVPFAIASRRVPRTLPSYPAYRERERSFLVENGLLDAGDSDPEQPP